MITQMGDSYLVAIIQIYPLHTVKEYYNAKKKKKKQKNTRDIIQGGNSKRSKLKDKLRGLSDLLGNVFEHLA
jgi:hypothetical protein